MKTILVTGGAGFIGTNLCKRLLDQGNNVIAIDNFITSTDDNLKELKNYPNFKFIKHDITIPFPKFLMSHLSSLISVYHLACPTGVPNLLPLGEEMLMTCSIGTKNVLDIAMKHKAKVLFTSSSEIYGDPEIFPQTEAYTGNVEPTGIRSTYEEGKRFSESLVAFYVRKYKLDAKIVRIFNTYGPYMTRTDTRVIPHFINQLQQHKPLTIQGEGSQKRTFCYVDDLIEGFFTIMEKGTAGEAYNLGGEQEYTIKELAERMIALTNKNQFRYSGERKQLQNLSTAQQDNVRDSGHLPANDRRLQARARMTFIPRPEHDHQARRPDLTKVKKLGWDQTITLEEGLERIIREYHLV